MTATKGVPATWAEAQRQDQDPETEAPTVPPIPATWAEAEAADCAQRETSTTEEARR